MTRPVLLDNTVLTNLALVNRADLVTRLWGTAAGTTPAAMTEYQVGAQSGLLPPDAWANLPALTLTEEETRCATSLPPRLGTGERACLAVAVHRQGLLVTDDLDARNAAREQHVPVTGTLGVLVACVRQGHLSRQQANALLSDMIAAGFRSPVTDLSQLLDKQN